MRPRFISEPSDLATERAAETSAFEAPPSGPLDNPFPGDRHPASLSPVDRERPAPGGPREPVLRRAGTPPALDPICMDLVSEVSRELRSPLTSIKGFAETLLDGAVDDPREARRFLEIIARQADRLGAMVETLLILPQIQMDSRETGGDPLGAALEEVLTSSLRDLESRVALSRGRISLSCEPGLRSPIHPGLFRQAVSNLADHALGERKEAADLEVSAVRNGDEIRVAFRTRENGNGISHGPGEEHGKEAPRGPLRGSRLSLSIATCIVRTRGGTVEAENGNGKCRAWILRLPGAR